MALYLGENQIYNVITSNVNNGVSKPVIEELIVTKNGTYNVPENVDGYSPVIVAVEGVGEDSYMLDELIAGNASDINSSAANVRQYAFYYHDKLTSVNLPMATNIEYSAFQNCTSLTSIDASLVNHVASSAFYSCESLTSVNMPLVTYIGDDSFHWCESLSSVNMPLVTTLGYGAFGNCNALTSIDFPLDINIGWGAFKNCNALTYVNIPLVTDVTSEAFYNCSSLTAIDLPSVSNIESYAFYDCSSLSTLTIRNKKSVCAASYNAFNGTPIAQGIGTIFVPYVLLDKYKSADTWVMYADQIKPIEKIYIFDTNRINASFNGTYSKSINYICDDGLPTITVTSNNESVANVANVSYSNGTLTFDVNSLSTEGTATITIHMMSSNESCETSFDVKVYEVLPTPTYSVEAVDGASYGFALNDNGYYESQNIGQDSSAAVCKVVFDTKGMYNMYLDCINYAEEYYDYGILSDVDKELGLSHEENSDSNDLIFKSFVGLNEQDVQVVDYGLVEDGEHFIYVKFIKDISGEDNNDSLQFKVRFE